MRWRRSFRSAPVSSAISAAACFGCAARTVTPTVYIVTSSQPGGSDPDSVMPSVAMISVAWVQPIGRVAVEFASSRIAVAPFGRILRREATSWAMPSWSSTLATCCPAVEALVSGT